MGVSDSGSGMGVAGRCQARSEGVTVSGRTSLTCGNVLQQLLRRLARSVRIEMLISLYDGAAIQALASDCRRSVTPQTATQADRIRHATPPRSGTVRHSPAVFDREVELAGQYQTDPLHRIPGVARSLVRHWGPATHPKT